MKENNNECFEVAEKRYNELMDLINLLEKTSDNEDEEQIRQFFNKYLPLEIYNIFEVYIKSIVGNLIDIIENRGIKKELISGKLLNKHLCRKFKKLLKSNKKEEDAVREYNLYYESLNEEVIKIEKVKDFTFNDYKHKPRKLEEVLDMLLNKNKILEKIEILKNPLDKSCDEGINVKNYVGFNVVLNNFAEERNKIVHDHIEIEQNNERTLENVKELIQLIFDGLSQLNDIYLEYVKQIK